MSVEGAYAHLSECLDGYAVLGEPMARHTTYHIGGPAALYVACHTLSDLSTTLETLAQEGVEWTICGKGSNLLVSDEGYGGAVVTLGGQFSQQDFGPQGSEDGAEEQEPGQEVIVTAGAGCVLSRLVQTAHRRALSGFEFAVGIPGTLGGAIKMNAGNRDEWISTIVDTVTTYTPGKGLRLVRRDDMAWGYRRSGFSPDEVIVEATLRLKTADAMWMRARMEAARKRRQRSQPLDMPSCGSVFRNPEGGSAGQLIESCGLKGLENGGARISDKHANFIVNTGNATALDVLGLVHIARNRVREVHAVELRPEVRFLGFSS